MLQWKNGTLLKPIIINKDICLEETLLSGPRKKTLLCGPTQKDPIEWPHTKRPYWVAPHNIIDTDTG